MRYIIYGAGAIGGTIGARLSKIGADVLLIARGKHLACVTAILTPMRDWMSQRLATRARSTSGPAILSC